MRPKNCSRRRQYLCSLFAYVVFLSCGLSAGQQADQGIDPLLDGPKRSIPETKGFLARWAEFYRQDRAGATASLPAPRRLGLPSPLDSPPFPNADWSYGGSPVIGEPDTNSYPLMTAINQARSRTKIYGWVDPTLNFSASAHRNDPEANDVYSNRFEMNQLILYAERLPESVQRDHVDWGYHLTALYGTDYRFTIATVTLNDQWLVQLGITGGHDVALWTADAKPSGTGCVSYTTKSVNDNFYVCANGINDGKYAYNNLQQYDATWYHKFSKTVHMATEAWYMYERRACDRRQYSAGNRRRCRALPDRRTALHGSRICRG